MSVQFWLNFEYYICWIISTLAAFCLSYQIYQWSRFLGGVRFWFFTSLMTVCFVYGALNAALIIIGLNGIYFESNEYLIKPMLWFSRTRMYANTSVLAFLVFVTTLANHRSRTASEEEQETLIDAVQIIAYSKEERRRARAIRLNAENYLHTSK